MAWFAFGVDPHGRWAIRGTAGERLPAPRFRRRWQARRWCGQLNRMPEITTGPYEPVDLDDQ